eukprot:g712.t1
MELVNESSDCFVLCDVSSVRYPILHSSNGFQKLYGQGEGDWWDAVQTGRSERLHHPTLGWSYLLGIHREVTAGLPVEEVSLRNSAQERMEKKLVDENACNKVKYRSAEVETLASVSTACSMSSIARKTEGKGTTRLTFEPCFHLGALARGEGTTETTETKTTTESGRSSGRSDSEDSGGGSRYPAWVG